MIHKLTIIALKFINIHNMSTNIKYNIQNKIFQNINLYIFFPFLSLSKWVEQGVNHMKNIGTLMQMMQYKWLCMWGWSFSKLSPTLTLRSTTVSDAAKKSKCSSIKLIRELRWLRLSWIWPKTSMTWANDGAPGSWAYGAWACGSYTVGAYSSPLSSLSTIPLTLTKMPLLLLSI